MDTFSYEVAPTVRGHGDRSAVYWSVAWRIQGPPLPLGPLQTIDADEVERVRQVLALQRIERAAEGALAS